LSNLLTPVIFGHHRGNFVSRVHPHSHSILMKFSITN